MNTLFTLVRKKGDNGETEVLAKDTIHAVAEQYKNLVLLGTPETALEISSEEVEGLKTHIETLRKRIDDYQHDFNVVASAIREEAEDRDWCSEYDNFVDAVNGKTRILELETRSREITIEVTLAVTVDCKHGEEDDMIYTVTNDLCSYDYDVQSTDWQES